MLKSLRLTRDHLILLALGLSLIAALVAINLLVVRLDPDTSSGAWTFLLTGLILFWTIPILLRSQRARLGAFWTGLAAIADRERTPEPGNRLLNLFLISFVVLFVETMLIRYIGSQTRIFAFYKNIPLIGAFLGLGIGCFRGGGGRREALWFLAGMSGVAVFFAAAAQSLGGLLGLSASNASSEQVFGYTVISHVPPLLIKLLANIHVGLYCTAVFIGLGWLFGFLGQILGAGFEGLPRLKAYSVNILGSLGGLAAFVTLSRLSTPPWIWFLVGLTPLLWWLGRGGALRAGLVFAAISVFAVAPHVSDTVWSTYQKLVGWKGANGYKIDISDAFYQMALDLSPAAIARYGYNPLPQYDAEFAGLPKPGRVLIVGAGSGNDVAAALRAGAEHVDAVDIDAAIVEMGRQHHPEHPYDDPRVSVIVDDARSAFKSLPRASYDMVVFGVLDSHTQLAASSVRLDNYVFTQESFSAAAALLRPGGTLVIAAITGADWFRDRYAGMLQHACGSPVRQQIFEVHTVFQCSAVTADPDPGATGWAIGAPVDDWPFPYLPSRAVPMTYIAVIGMLVVGSIYWLRRNGIGTVDVKAFTAHMFFLGAAFLLMEVYAINRLALLFGTTWLVSAVSIATMLIEIMVANILVGLTRLDLRPFAYVALAALLLAGWGIGPEAALGKGPVVGMLYALFLLSPVFCAGIIFATSFDRSASAQTALGANILGAVLGGWAEYATMVTGIRFMALVALALYAASLIALLVSRRASRAGARVPSSAS